jgi:uncharacterized protein
MMKIAIISDTHDNLATMKKTVGWIRGEKIKLLIHCGDVSKQEILKEALEEFSGKVFLSKGNCDLGDFEKVPGLKLKENFGEISAGGKKMAFCHFPDIASELAKTGKYHIVFCGHTHKPWIADEGKTIIANPGNLAGVFYRATFAVYDTKTGKLELKILDQLEKNEL